MKHFYSFVFCCIIFSSSFAQRICATYDYSKNLPFSNIVLSGRGNATGRDTLANEVINIPVVIHLLYNNNTQNISDSQIISQLKVLNLDYSKLNPDIVNIPNVFASLAADIKIKFCGHSPEFKTATRPESWHYWGSIEILHTH